MSLGIWKDSISYVPKRKSMGWITWVIIAAVTLVILGLGVQAFLSGLWTGAQKVGGNPVVQNVTGEAKEFVKGSIRNSSMSVVGK